MIPYDLDPSLHTAEPGSTMLDDGFSPPQHERVAPEKVVAPEKEYKLSESPPDVPTDPGLWAKSAF
jgi:hypothetical protein